MNPDLHEWIHLILRWAHVIAGIMWIGGTYLFNWMERSLVPPDKPGEKPNISGELWMVHGGGFYLVEKQKWPLVMPKTLHWFRWEAMWTYITGFALLVAVYWSGAPLLPYGSSLSRLAGIGISLGVLAGGWLAYNLLWNWSPLGRHEAAGAAVSWVLILGLAHGLMGVLSDRAVYLHVGAMFGTIMITNVWMIILPNQRRMMAITREGGAARPELAVQSGRCSRHNTYMSVPLLITMMSSHFPSITYGSEHPVAVLGGLVLFGWVAAKLLREHF